MKCGKCGFVSFDYLSECKKCGVNLVETREVLGFNSAKPAVPFFLGSLVRNYVKPAESSESGHETGFPADSSFSLDFGEESDHEDASAGFRPEEPLGLDSTDVHGGFNNAAKFDFEPEIEESNKPEPFRFDPSSEFEPAGTYRDSGSTDVSSGQDKEESEPVAAVGAPGGGESESFNLLDLSDEELDLLLAGDENGKGKVAGQKLVAQQSFPDSAHREGADESDWSEADDLELDLKLEEVLRKPEQKRPDPLFHAEEKSDAPDPGATDDLKLNLDLDYAPRATENKDIMLVPTPEIDASEAVDDLDLDLVVKNMPQRDKKDMRFIPEHKVEAPDNVAVDDLDLDLDLAMQNMPQRDKKDMRLIPEHRVETRDHGAVDDLDLDMQMENMAPIREKKGTGLIPEFDVEAMPGLSGKSSRPQDAAPFDVEREPITVEDENFQITLSEKDLESLLADLENVSQKKGKTDEEL